MGVSTYGSKAVLTSEISEQVLFINLHEFQWNAFAEVPVHYILQSRAILEHDSYNPNDGCSSSGSIILKQ